MLPILSLLLALLPAGDNHPVSIGHNTNLQDGVFVGDMNPLGQPTSVGSFVSVGHGAVLQGCKVADKSLIGMNAVLQGGVTVSTRGKRGELGAVVLYMCCCL